MSDERKHFKPWWIPETPEHKKRVADPMRTADIKYLQSKYWRGIRRQILERDMYLCKECERMGLTNEGNQVDHIHARKDNANYEKYNEDLDNLQTLCRSCHATKTIKERNARK